MRSAAALCVVAALTLAACRPPVADPPVTDPPKPARVEANATVERVVDGDTIVVEVGGRRETVRLIGIDTPETVKPNAPVECYGPEASARTHQLLPPGTAIRLERDVEARDDYGRLLAYVVRAADGLFVNLALVDAGVAQPSTFPPNTTHMTEFVAAATAAERAGVGLWSACGG